MVKNKKEDLMERRRCGNYNLKFSYSSKMQWLFTVVVLDFVLCVTNYDLGIQI